MFVQWSAVNDCRTILKIYRICIPRFLRTMNMRANNMIKINHAARPEHKKPLHIVYVVRSVIKKKTKTVETATSNNDRDDYVDTTRS